MSAARQWCSTCQYAVPLAAGAAAGVTVEATLFPLDCVKTRLQSGVFREAGGYCSLYRGVGVSVAGAVPSSALFFCTYELMKERHGSVVLASIVAELAASSVRVPVDLVKQRLQAGLAPGLTSALLDLRKTPGRVMFAAFRISAARDAAHSGLQYPIYEHLKIVAARRLQCRSPEDLPVWQAAMCGSAAGALSAWATTPLDLLRTRLNLQRTGAASLAGAAVPASQPSLLAREVRDLVQGSGGYMGMLRTLFAGAGCRAAWMGLGGFIFLGSFEFARKNLRQAAGISESALPAQETSQSIPVPASMAENQQQQHRPQQQLPQHLSHQLPQQQQLQLQLQHLQQQRQEQQQSAQQQPPPLLAVKAASSGQQRGEHESTSALTCVQC